MTESEVDFTLCFLCIFHFPFSIFNLKKCLHSDNVCDMIKGKIIFCKGFDENEKENCESDSVDIGGIDDRGSFRGL